MTDILKCVLAMSAAGSIAEILAFITEKFFGKMLEAQVFYYVRLFVLFIFLIPVKLPIESTVPVSYVEFYYVKNTGISVTDAAAWIWFGVMIIVFAVKVTKYFIFKCSLYRCSEETADIDGVPKMLTVRYGDMLDSPMIVGVLKPLLILPKMDERELKYVLSHELVHYKRKDLLWKWAGELVKAVHWFNPLAGCAAKNFSNTCEISCDLKAVKDLTLEERKNYMRVILNLISGRRDSGKQVSYHMAKEKELLKRRFDMIINLKKKRPCLKAFSAAVGAVVCGVSIIFGGLVAAAVDEKADIIGDFLLPTGKISVPYSPEHGGVDYAIAKGESVLSANDGTVTYADYDYRHGNMIVVEHEGGYTTTYCHMSALNAKAGDSVEKGAKIGEVGSTGMSVGPHLHFEMKKDGNAVDPFNMN